MLVKYFNILFNLPIERSYNLKVSKNDFINKLKAHNKLDVVLYENSSSKFQVKILPIKDFVIDLLIIKGEINDDDSKIPQLEIKFFGTKLLSLFMIIYSAIYFFVFIILFKENVSYIFFLSLGVFYLFTCVVLAAELRKRILFFENEINTF